MTIGNKIPANKGKGAGKGKADAAPKKSFGAATAYAAPAKTKAGLTGSPKKK
jgi:hypothetical protein